MSRRKPTADRPRVCLVTQYYVPELGAPQTRLSELAVRLKSAGWDVCVLTTVPNYPTGVVRDPYKAWRSCVEEVDGVKVARVPIYAAGGSGAKRMLCFLSFAASAAINGPRLLSPPDVMLVESPPLTIVATAWALKAWWRCPYVLNVSDLWPDSAVRLGALGPGRVLQFAKWLERAAYRKSSAVTGTSQEILRHVTGISPKTATHEVTNGVDPDRFGPHLRTREARVDLTSHDDLPVFAFAGLVGLAQGLDQVLEAANILRQRHGRPIAAFAIIGDGPARSALEEQSKTAGLDEVKFLGGRERNAIPALLASSDAAIITLGTVLPGAIPSKIYEAMASALPIVLVASGEATTRIEQAHAGITLPPGDTQALATAIETLATDRALRAAYGTDGRAAAETTYNRNRIASDLDQFLRTAIGAER